MNNFLARTAVFPGTVHRQEFLPCQDAVGFHIIPHFTSGVYAAAAAVADGCGSSHHSQVGAELIAQTTPLALCKLVKSHGIKNKDKIATELWKLVIWDLCDFISKRPGGRKYVEDLEKERRGGKAMDLYNPLLSYIDKFVYDNFLFTLVMAFISDEGILILRRGDGGFIVDDNTLDMLHYKGKEAAPYLGYDLISPATFAARLAASGLICDLEPRGFSSWFFAGARRVTLFTDGIDTIEYLDGIWDLADPPERWHNANNPRRNRLYTSVREWSLTRDATRPCDDMGVAVMINTS